MVLLNVELKHKSRWDNVVLKVLNQQDEFQIEKPSTKT
jgi:hypothetical protein